MRVGGKKEEGRRVSDHEYGRYRPGTSGCFIHMKRLEGGKRELEDVEDSCTR